MLHLELHKRSKPPHPLWPLCCILNFTRDLNPATPSDCYVASWTSQEIKTPASDHYVACFGFLSRLFGFRRIVFGFRRRPFGFRIIIGYRRMVFGFRIITGFRRILVGSPASETKKSRFRNQNVRFRNPNVRFMQPLRIFPSSQLSTKDRESLFNWLSQLLDLKSKANSLWHDFEASEWYKTLGIRFLPYLPSRKMQQALLTAFRPRAAWSMALPPSWERCVRIWQICSKAVEFVLLDATCNFHLSFEANQVYHGWWKGVFSQCQKPSESSM